LAEKRAAAAAEKALKDAEEKPEVEGVEEGE
jgi:hypothetical protein